MLFYVKYCALLLNILNTNINPFDGGKFYQNDRSLDAMKDH